MTHYLTGDAAQCLDTKVQFHILKMAFQDDFMRRYTGSMVVKVVLNGMREHRLRYVILKCMTENDSIADVLDKVRTAESQLPANQNQGRVFSMADGEEPFNSSTHPEAIDKISGFKGKGKIEDPDVGL